MAWCAEFLTGVFPLALLLLAVVASEHETVLGMNGLLFGALIMVAGFLIYFVSRKLKILHAKPVVTRTMDEPETP